ncbi:hypothetical protein FOMPIDRAFT_90355 [Fomitopsis schrenkii]|uniref:Uncharacterized protein n=1 Tax=Fomitopsis schrenkii TaxID=2126942 RepID=S8E2M1_FOMSC|nr:hypothetical protein FOMPIDRAFT_90355 [Fomitopsis schrenkii]
MPRRSARGSYFYRVPWKGAPRPSQAAPPPQVLLHLQWTWTLLCASQGGTRNRINALSELDNLTDAQIVQRLDVAPRLSDDEHGLGVNAISRITGTVVAKAAQDCEEDADHPSEAIRLDDPLKPSPSSWSSSK